MNAVPCGWRISVIAGIVARRGAHDVHDRGRRPPGGRAPDAGRGARGSAVICHAHPRHGGQGPPGPVGDPERARGEARPRDPRPQLPRDMGSAGEFGGGLEEIEDVRAAIGRPRASDGPTLVVGWSFGASVALGRPSMTIASTSSPSSASPRPNDLKMPPRPSHEDLARLRRPLLSLLTGEHDEYCPAEELRTYGDGVAEVAIVDGVDHYLSKKEREAAAIIGDFAQRLLDRPGTITDTMRRMAETGGTWRCMAIGSPCLCRDRGKRRARVRLVGRRRRRSWPRRSPRHRTRSNRRADPGSPAQVRESWQSLDLLYLLVEQIGSRSSFPAGSARSLGTPNREASILVSSQPFWIDPATQTAPVAGLLARPRHCLELSTATSASPRRSGVRSGSTNTISASSRHIRGRGSE